MGKSPISTVSIVSFIIAGILVVLSLVASFLKIIPNSLLDSIILAVAAFFSNGAVLIHIVHFSNNQKNGGK